MGTRKNKKCKYVIIYSTSNCIGMSYMGQCKKCGKVYGVFQLTDGICLRCLTPEYIADSEKRKIQETRKKQSKDLKKIFINALSINMIGIFFLISMQTDFAMVVVYFSIPMFFIIILGNFISMKAIRKHLKTNYHNRLLVLLFSLVLLDILVLIAVNTDYNFHA